MTLTVYYKERMTKRPACSIGENKGNFAGLHRLSAASPDMGKNVNNTI